MACNGPKKGSFHLFRHPQWSRIIFGKTHFYPFFVPKQPIFKAFWDFRRAKMGHRELKTRPKHLFWHSTWSRIIFGKSHLFAPSGPCWPILAPTSLGYFLQPVAAHWA